MRFLKEHSDYWRRILCRYYPDGSRNEKQCYIMPEKYYNEDGYARIKIKPPWENTRKNIRLHRISYFLYYKPDILEEETLLSHLCHTKACINPLHLSAEPLDLNIARKYCFNKQNCTQMYIFSV